MWSLHVDFAWLFSVWKRLRPSNAHKIYAKEDVERIEKELGAKFARLSECGFKHLPPLYRSCTVEVRGEKGSLLEMRNEPDSRGYVLGHFIEICFVHRLETPYSFCGMTHSKRVSIPFITIFTDQTHFGGTYHVWEAGSDDFDTVIGFGPLVERVEEIVEMFTLAMQGEEQPTAAVLPFTPKVVSD